MTLTPEQRSLLRNCLLTQLHDVRPHSVTLRTLHMGIRQIGFAEVSESECAAEMAYLEDKALAARVGDTLSSAVKAWRLTSTGTDHVEAHVL